jgi:hypothetical protein
MRPVWGQGEARTLLTGAAPRRMGRRISARVRRPLPLTRKSAAKSLGRPRIYRTFVAACACSRPTACAPAPEGPDDRFEPVDSFPARREAGGDRRGSLAPHDAATVASNAKCWRFSRDRRSCCSNAWPAPRPHSPPLPLIRSRDPRAASGHGAWRGRPNASSRRLVKVARQPCKRPSPNLRAPVPRLAPRSVRAWPAMPAALAAPISRFNLDRDA